MTTPQFLLAIDVGNSAVKCGWFLCDEARRAVRPIDSCWSDLRDPPLGPRPSLQQWLRTGCLAHPPSEVRLVSVNERAAHTVQAALGELARAVPLRRLRYEDFPLEVGTEAPAQVGVDRLAAAAGAATLSGQPPNQPALIVDVGTAVTVDLLVPDHDGRPVFQGGAILPGPVVLSRSLADTTEKLPAVDWPVDRRNHPPALGTNTVEAIHSGLYWGLIGGIHELLARISAKLDKPAETWLTGGHAHHVHPHLTTAHRWEPHLTLIGAAACDPARTD